MTDQTSAEKIRWDLSIFYSGIDDPQLDADLQTFLAQATAFRTNYKGNLVEKLSAAIGDYANMRMLGEKIMVYLFLGQSLDVADAALKSKTAEAERAMSYADGEFLTFFSLELVALDDDVLEKYYAKEPTVAKHRPWIEHLRLFKPNLLSEPVEAALTKRSPFGSAAWGEFFDECESDLRFEGIDGQKTLVQMLDMLGTLKDAALRAETLKKINDGLGGHFAKYSATTLYMGVGEDAVERKERNYHHPMEARNKSNQIPDEAVEALHAAVMNIGGPLAKRYYRLKARLLGKTTLSWSDRNAPLPFSDDTIVPFHEALDMVLAAYESFSPTLAAVIRELAAAKRIDAAAKQGKRGGAFNYSIVLPGNQPVSYTFLNYLGSNRDVMTLAHELGHGVHGMLAGEAQGVLMSQAPIAYAETASVFGEMTTFNFLKKHLIEKQNAEATLALLTGKIEDALNTLVRQIAFSNFERRLHGMDAAYAKWSDPKKFSVSEIDSLWLQTQKEMYGEDGDVFTYENAEHMWAYISHFHRPFYVYGYAFGELLTQSLYAQQNKLGERFEPLYLDLLRSGATKDVSQLLEPFGLDPIHKTFWEDGLRVGLEAMIQEAEKLSQALYNVNL